MARAVATLGTLVMLLHAAPTVEAGDQDRDTLAGVAAEAKVDETDLLGALLSQGLDNPREYLESIGELARPAAMSPIPASVMARVSCIEARESGGVNTWNSRGSGAGGVMQYMPSTFAAHAREMGHPEWSLWNPAQARQVAAHDLLMGRRAQWTVGGC